MSQIEDFYEKVLGFPKKGDLEALERHYRKKSSEIQGHPDNRVDISIIQKNGELKNAYLFLKARWSIERTRKSGLIHDGQIIKPMKFTGGKKKDKLQNLHSNLKWLVQGGVLAVIATAVLQFSFGILGPIPKLSASTRKPTKNHIVLKKGDRLISRSSTETRGEYIRGAFAPVDPGSEVMRAAKKCDLKNLRKELRDNSGARFANSRGETALHWLARINCWQGVEIALAYGANPNQRDASGKTPLDWADASSSFESMQVFTLRNR